MATSSENLDMPNTPLHSATTNHEIMQRPNIERSISDGRVSILLEKLPIISEEDIADEGACLICWEPYFAHHNGENPMKLLCGHHFGEKCLLEWISESDSCPQCRRPVLEEATLQSVEQDSRRIEYEYVAMANPRQPVALEALLPHEVRWAEEAEELWKEFCEDLVQILDTIIDWEDWCCARGCVARQIIDLATVACFAVTRHALMPRLMGPGYDDMYHESYTKLCAHLDQKADRADDGIFLTAGTSYFLWLASLHEKINATHERLMDRLRPAGVPHPRSYE